MGLRAKQGGDARHAGPAGMGQCARRAPVKSIHPRPQRFGHHLDSAPLGAQVRASFRLDIGVPHLGTTCLRRSPRACSPDSLIMHWHVQDCTVRSLFHSPQVQHGGGSTHMLLCMQQASEGPTSANIALLFVCAAHRAPAQALLGGSAHRCAELRLWRTQAGSQSAVRAPRRRFISVWD